MDDVNNNELNADTPKDSLWHASELCTRAVRIDDASGAVHIVCGMELDKYDLSAVLHDHASTLNINIDVFSVQNNIIIVSVDEARIDEVLIDLRHELEPTDVRYQGVARLLYQMCPKCGRHSTARAAGGSITLDQMLNDTDFVTLQHAAELSTGVLSIELTDNNQTVLVALNDWASQNGKRAERAVATFARNAGIELEGSIEHHHSLPTPEELGSTRLMFGGSNRKSGFGSLLELFLP